jgi:hypothetical protein
MSWLEDQGYDGYDEDDLEPGWWRTRDGRQMKISEMDDEHLLNAYTLTSNEELFEEMVLRLFADRIRARGWE